MSGDATNTTRTLALMQAGLTRRQLLRVLGVSTIGIASAGLLAACETDDDDGEDVAATEADDEVVVEVDDEPEDEPDEDTEAEDEEEEIETDDDEPEDTEGDRPPLRLGVHGIPPTLDPTTNVTLIGYLTQYSIFDMLIRRDWLDSDPPGFGNTLVPGIAEDWEFLDDTTLEFRIRTDATWHNGDPVTADDVIFTYQRILDQEMAELATAASDFVTVSHIEKIDDSTVHFVTHDPDPLLQMRVAVRVGWILPQEYYSEVGQEGFAMNPVGSGPYKVVDFAPAEYILCESHDDYFLGQPTASRVEWRMIPEVSSRVSALVSGEIDIATNIPPDQWETLENAEGVHPVGVESLSMHVLRLNSNHPHLSDSRVRQALSYAIDRELIVESLWNGRASVPYGHQHNDFPEDILFSEFQLPYDPDRARELLDEAGYDGELILYRVHPSQYTLGPEVAQAVVAMWQEVGINAEIELTEDHWVADEDAMVHHVTNASNMADPAGSQWTTWGAGSGTQQDFWPAPDEYNELGLEQMATLDRERRVEIWRQMQTIWMDERPGLPLFNPIETYGIRDGVEWQPYGILYLDIRPYNLEFRD